MIEENSGDSNETIILDIGSCFAKSGWSGEEEPRFNYRSVVGYPKFKQVATHTAHIKECYVGAEAQEKRSMLALKPLISNHNETNWDNVEMLLHNIFFCDLRTNPEEHSVYSTYHPQEPHVGQKYTQILFETFSVPGFYSRHASMLAMTATGNPTSLVVDIGHSITYTSAVFQNKKIVYPRNRINIGGDNCTQYLQTTLTEHGYYFETSDEYESIREMKEKLSFVALDYDEEMYKSKCYSDVEREYQLPDGQIVTLGDHRFRCTEILFQPNMISKESPGVHELAYNHMQQCDNEARELLATNVLLIGGCSRIPGLDERFKKEMLNLLPSSAKVRVTVGKENIAWFGASLAASMSTFHSSKITIDEYAELGPSIFVRKAENQY